MEIRCPSCQTRYELELELVQAGPVRVQCVRCTSIFKVESRAARTDTWKIRRRDGQVVDFDGLHTLQRWIVERRVERDDEISRTGEQWKTLGAITELSSFFAVIDELDRTSSADHDLPDVLAGLDALDAIHFDADAPDLVVTDDDDDDDDDDDLTQALLASLSVEKSQERRPISSIAPVVDPDALRALSTRIDDAPELDIELEAPAIGPTLIAHPKPPRAQALHQLPEAAAAPAPAESQDAAAVPVGMPLAPQPAPPRPAPPQPQPVDIGPTGAGWFSDEPARTGAEAPQAGPASPLVLDEPLPRVTGSRSTILIAAVVGLAVAALVVALATGGGEATTNQATATPVDDEAAVAETTASPGPADSVVAADETGNAAPEQAPADAQPQDASPSSAPTADEAPEQPEAPSEPVESAAADESDAAERAPRERSRDGGSSGGGYASHLKRADRARDKGDLQTALTEYEAALVAKRTAEAYAGMGWTYIGLGDAYRASSFFERAIKLESGYGDAYIGLGKAYQKLGKKKQALATYDDYLERFPRGPQRSIAQGQSRKLQADLAESAAPKPQPKPNNTATPTPADSSATTDDDKKVIIIKKAP